MNNELRKVIEKYLIKGIIKGGEFLLPPDIMIPFIDDLSKFRVKITGCDLWQYLDSDKNPKRIVQLLGVGISIDNINDPRKDTLLGFAEVMKDYIRKNLPDDAQLVSLNFDDAEMYKFFRSLQSKGPPPLLC
jgi:hypothetical protein